MKVIVDLLAASLNVRLLKPYSSHLKTFSEYSNQLVSAWHRQCLPIYEAAFVLIERCNSKLITTKSNL